MNLHELLHLVAGARHAGIPLEDRIHIIEDTIIAMTAPDCCGQPAHYNAGTGQFVCEGCLATVGSI